MMTPLAMMMILYVDDEMDGRVESPNHEDMLASTGRILEQQPAFDKIINAEVMI